MVLFSRLGPYDVSELTGALERATSSSTGRTSSPDGLRDPPRVHAPVSARRPDAGAVRPRVARGERRVPPVRPPGAAAPRAASLAGPRGPRDRAVADGRLERREGARPDARHPLVPGRHRDRGADGNERVWDLAERRLPRDEPRWPPAEVARAVVEGGLRRIGVARRGELGRQLDGNPPGADAAFRALVREEVAVPSGSQGWTANGGPTATCSGASPGGPHWFCSPRSTGSSTTATARASSSTSTTGSRCT